jgi:hypothetical protein
LSILIAFIYPPQPSPIAPPLPGISREMIPDRCVHTEFDSMILKVLLPNAIVKFKIVVHPIYNYWSCAHDPNDARQFRQRMDGRNSD